MFQHSEKCKEDFREYEKKMAEWKLLWPDYCKACYGLGAIHQAGDWVPYGSTSVQNPDWIEACTECVDQGKCGRCGSQIDPLGNLLQLDWDYITCLVCEWTDTPEKQTEDMVSPELKAVYYEICECELDYMKELADKYRELGI